MAHLVRGLCIAFVLLVPAACVAPPSAPSGRTERSRAELSESLLDLADLFISRYQAVYLKAAIAGEDSPEMRRIRDEAFVEIRVPELAPEGTAPAAPPAKPES